MGNKAPKAVVDSLVGKNFNDILGGMEVDVIRSSVLGMDYDLQKVSNKKEEKPKVKVEEFYKEQPVVVHLLRRFG